MMYTIDCSCSMSKRVKVEANSLEEAKRKAQAEYEQDDLNTWTPVDFVAEESMTR